MTTPSHRATPARSRAAAAALVAVALGAAACERVSHWTSGPEAAAADDGGPIGVGPGGPSGGPGAGSGGGGNAVAATVTVGTGTEIVPADKAAVLEAVATCAVELYDVVGERTGALVEATEKAAATGAAADRDAARDAWRAAIDAWQQAELVRVGPAGSATLPAGRNLRDEIYSWPLVSRCLVDQTIVSAKYEEAGFAASSLINVRGLAAAEYLLFHEGSDNGCNASSGINSTGAWAALGAAEIAERKADYAAVVAGGVDAEARAIADGWSAAGGDFAAVLAGAGRSGSPFASDHSAIEAVAHGLFYLEREMKDLKVGKPLGRYECDESECLDAVESPYARRSARHVQNNLIGFLRVFDGCEAAGNVGYDDLLATHGAGDLGAQMQADVLTAIAVAGAIEEDDLAVAILQDRPSVEALHASIKRLTDELKTEFVSVLDIEPPATIEGDND